MKLNKNWNKICYSIRPVEETIDEQPKVDRWIPVEKRLPPIWTEVLLFVEEYRGCHYPRREEMYVGYRRGEGEEMEYIIYEDSWNPKDIIAWMPLPEPYRKEN